MNNNSPQDPQTQWNSTWQTLAESEKSLAGIFSRMFENLVKIQSEALASNLRENVASLAPPDTAGQGQAHIMWRMPALYQARSQRRVGQLRDSFAVLSEAQQQLLELTCQSLMGNARKSGAALSQLNGVFFSRRVSAEVIKFPERRALATESEAQTLQPEGKAESRKRHASA